MKKIFLFILMFIALHSFSQTPKEIKITKKQLNDSKTLSDFISDIPKDCKIKHYIFSANLVGGLKQYTCVNDSIRAELKTELNRKSKGQIFFIEEIKSDCMKSHKSIYKITLE